MALIALKCPVCSGTIEAQENCEYVRCPFCGTDVKLPERKKIIIETVNKSDESRHQNYLGLAHQAYISHNYEEAGRYYGKALKYQNDPFSLFRYGLCHIHQTRGVEDGWQGLKPFLESQIDAGTDVHQQISTELCELADSIGPLSRPPIDARYKAENYEHQLFQVTETFGELFPYIYGDLCDPVLYGRYLEYARAYASRLVVGSIVWTDPVSKKECSLSIPMDHQRIASTYMNQYRKAIHSNNQALLRLKQNRMEELIHRLRGLPLSKWILYYYATRWTLLIPLLTSLCLNIPILMYAALPSCFLHLGCVLLFMRSSERKDINYMLRDTLVTCKEILILRWNTG